MALLTNDLSLFDGGNKAILRIVGFVLLQRILFKGVNIQNMREKEFCIRCRNLLDGLEVPQIGREVVRYDILKDAGILRTESHGMEDF